MSATCCDHNHCVASGVALGYCCALWFALAINLVMFAVEIGASFLGDAANYAVAGRDRDLLPEIRSSWKVSFP